MPADRVSAHPRFTSLEDSFRETVRRYRAGRGSNLSRFQSSTADFSSTANGRLLLLLLFTRTTFFCKMKQKHLLLSAQVVEIWCFNFLHLNIEYIILLLSTGMPGYKTQCLVNRPSLHICWSTKHKSLLSGYMDLMFLMMYCPGF